MTTDVQICNTALVQVQRRTITDLADGSSEAADCAAIYEETRLRMLRMHTWNWAIKRQKLARESDTPVFGEDYQYQLPSDYLRLVAARDHAGDIWTVSNIKYQLEQDSLLSNAEDVWIAYVYDATDEAAMPPDFRYFFSMELAQVLAKTNTARVDRYRKERLRAERIAKSTDSIEDDIDYVEDDTWITDREL